MALNCRSTDDDLGWLLAIAFAMVLAVGPALSPTACRGRGRSTPPRRARQRGGMHGSPAEDLARSETELDAKATLPQARRTEDCLTFSAPRRTNQRWRRGPPAGVWPFQRHP